MPGPEPDEGLPKPEPDPPDPEGGDHEPDGPTGPECGQPEPECPPVLTLEELERLTALGRCAYIYLRDRRDREELTAELRVRIWRYWRHVGKIPEGPQRKAYVRQMARNIAWDILDRTGRQPPGPLPYPDDDPPALDDPADEALCKVLRAEVADILGRFAAVSLGNADKAWAWVQHHHRGWDCTKIARALGRGPSGRRTVGIWINQVTDHIKRELGIEPPGEPPEAEGSDDPAADESASDETSGRTGPDEPPASEKPEDPSTGER